MATDFNPRATGMRGCDWAGLLSTGSEGRVDNGPLLRSRGGCNASPK